MTGHDDHTAQEQTIVIVDDHELLAQGLAFRLRAAGHRAEPIAVGDRRRLIDQLRAREPDLVLLDLGLPVHGGGQSLVGPLTRTGLRVVVLTGSEDRLAWARCLADGAEAVLAKSEATDEIVETIDAVMDGVTVRPRQRVELAMLLDRYQADRAQRRSGFESLSRRERAVLTGLVAGRCTREIADRDSVSVATVRSQVKSMLTKLGVNSQLAAVARANELGWGQGLEPDLRAGNA